MAGNDVLYYYLGKAQKGDGKAAFDAARIMRERNMNEVLIQSQFRRSAELGYAPAQRTLGFYGLCGHLVKPESKISHIIYYKSFAPAIDWLAKAADNNDSISRFALVKCTQLGIGVEKDEEEAKRMMSELDVSSLSMDVIISVMFILDSLCRRAGNPVDPEACALLIAS